MQIYVLQKVDGIQKNYESDDAEAYLYPLNYRFISAHDCAVVIKGG